MDIAAWVQTLDEAVWISYGDNALRKDIQPIILPLAMSK